ncbi:PREDICTED: putative cleavage and polyadenylation specificity factor subunit 4-like protein [Gavialis gangeticus]|uniref:putative cleavage and polyadenylation specificity factor subunit 4-like protein n=1 Tax=Gavialis gangeticus TaxID=94835 RepID=UPI00092F3328|nr:PREDICTED: putative cleavage and polyadenylation specificity factor subunit 4-like protein [Gavialis gangeticus]
MQELVARVEKLTFKLEMDVMQQRGALPLPFPGMDKSGAAVCEFFLHGLCGKGLTCPFRHVCGEKSVVCKHWLRGLCKKGDHCEFLHEYDVTKMPECYFYSKFGECSNKECPFLHLDSASRAKDCPWYDEGFCKHGPLCRYKHTRRVVCTNYLAGFCPNGPRCKFVHPKANLMLDSLERSKGLPMTTDGVGGRKPSLPEAQLFPCPSRGSSAQHPAKKAPGTSGYPYGSLRPLEQVTCFKCGEKGHYANKCGKGRLGMLLGK